MAIGFSATRNDYYKSVIISNNMTCLAMAVISSLLLKVDRLIIILIAREPLVDFRFFNTVDDNILFIIFSLFIGFLTLVAISNFIGVLLYRVGAIKFWVSVLFLFIFIQMNHFSIAKSIWNSIGKIFTTRITSINLIYLLIIISIFYTLGYFILRGTDVKYSKN